MKLLFLSVLLCTIGTAVNAQDAAELERRNGFKSIKLGTSVDSIAGAVLKKDFKERDEFPARVYDVINDDFKKIGEVDVKEIQLMTYQDLIYKIVVVTDKDSRVMRALEKSFGKSTYIVRTGNYKWWSENLSLTFHAHKHSLELIYRSHPVVKKMYADKGKKVDDIADDL